MAKIPEHLIEKIKAIPDSPGIYQMKDKNGNVIYVGKSKTLKSRVKSYFYADHKQKKIKQMMFHIHDIDIMTTDTHLEAQILECELIKEMKPIYNRQFKNDKNYVYLRVENDSRSRSLSIVNERLDEHCTGPFRSKSRLEEAINTFQNIYPITKCGQGYKFHYKVLPRSLEGEDFEKNKECLAEILLKEECMRSFLLEIEKKMETASTMFQYEMASIYRDIIEHLKYIGKKHLNRKSEFEDRDILMGERIESGHKVFFISNNQMILKKKYSHLTGDIIEAFIRQAQQLSEQAKDNIDEKRELDFKKIISAELRDNRTMTIAFIDGQYNIDQFINSL